MTKSGHPLALYTFFYWCNCQMGRDRTCPLSPGITITPICKMLMVRSASPTVLIPLHTVVNRQV